MWISQHKTHTTAYAAGETYWYQPVPRGLEIKIRDKLAVLRGWDVEEG
jgi:putative ATPase